MKQKIAWVTDSTAYVPPEVLSRYDIHIVPLQIIFDETSYEDGVDLAARELYKKINSSKTVPKTSQPPIGKFVELYENLKNDYDCAIAVHLSGKLSGTLNGSLQAAQLADFPVEIVDSKILSYPITELILNGIKLQEKGLDYKVIAESLRANAEKNENYILIGSLDQFYKGGRMSGAQYILGSILQIKPIIQIKDGAFEVYEKVRSEKKALNLIMQKLDDAVIRGTVTSVQILHGNIEEKALEVQKTINEKYPQLTSIVGPISSTIGAHAGEGTLALTWFNE